MHNVVLNVNGRDVTFAAATEVLLTLGPDAGKAHEQQVRAAAESGKLSVVARGNGRFELRGSEIGLLVFAVAYPDAALGIYMTLAAMRDARNEEAFIAAAAPAIETFKRDVSAVADGLAQVKASIDRRVKDGVADGVALKLVKLLNDTNAAPKTQRVEIVAMPERVVTTEVKRGTDGDIKTVTQRERDA